MRENPGSQFNDPAMFLQVLANSRRLHVLSLLRKAEWDVGSLAAAVGLSQSALSQHLAKLRSAGLVSVRREAQTIWYRCDTKSVDDIMRLLAVHFPEPTEFPCAA